MLQGIKDPWLKMPAIPSGRRMGDGSERFAPAVSIMVESGCQEELSPKFPRQRKVRRAHHAAQ